MLKEDVLQCQLKDVFESQDRVSITTQVVQPVHAHVQTATRQTVQCM